MHKKVRCYHPFFSYYKKQGGEVKLKSKVENSHFLKFSVLTHTCMIFSIMISENLTFFNSSLILILKIGSTVNLILKKILKVLLESAL